MKFKTAGIQTIGRLLGRGPNRGLLCLKGPELRLHEAI
jgi:hypothetical protein